MLKIIAIFALIMSTANARPAKYERGFAVVKAGSEQAIREKVEQAVSIIDNSIARFLGNGIVLIGTKNCGKLLRSDRDEPRHKWPKLRMKTRRIVTSSTIDSYFSYDDGSFNENFTARINFKCRVSRKKKN